MTMIELFEEYGTLLTILIQLMTALVLLLLNRTSGEMPEDYSGSFL